MDTLIHRYNRYFTTDTLYHCWVTGTRSVHLRIVCVLKWSNKKGKLPNIIRITFSAATPPVRTGVVGVLEDSNSTSPGEWDRQRRRIRMRNGREKTVGTSLLPLWGHVKTALRIREGGSYNSQKKPPVSLAPDNLSRGLRPFQPFHSVPIFSTPIIIVLDFFQVLFICRIRPRRQETERREGEGS